VNREYHIPDPENPYNYIERGIDQRLRPLFVDPPPALFRLPKDCPEQVRDYVISAFSLFWHDTGACANKLRSAIEALMDHLRVKRWTSNKKGRRRIDLHSRIESIRSRSPEIVDHLLAAKWIGNAGVHSDELTTSDLFDAMDLIEAALDEIIGKRSSSLKRIAKTITKRKRPRSQ